MGDLAATGAEETVTTWEFARGGFVLACQHIESSRGTHTFVITENGAVIERHVVSEDPRRPEESARRLNEVRQALRGIYQRRFAPSPEARGSKSYLEAKVISTIPA